MPTLKYWNGTGFVSVYGIGGGTFTSVAPGYAPASGGGTVNYLRADGTWAPINAANVPGISAFSQTVLDDTSATAWKDTLGLNALTAGTKITLPTPSGGSQPINVNMAAGVAGAQTWNGGLNDGDQLTINASTGAANGELELNSAAMDFNASGAFTLDAITITMFAAFGSNINNLTISQPTGDEAGTATPTPVQIITSGMTNDDVAEATRPSKTTTTDATIKTIQTIAAAAIPNDAVTTIEARVTAHRTGGASGTAGDSAFYLIYATFKDVGGTVTQVGTPTPTVTHESVAGWDAIIDTSGTNIRVRVTGAATTNISWGCITRMYSMGT